MLLHQYSATQLVELLKAGDITSNEVWESQLDRIHRLNPQINAIVAINERSPNSALGPLYGLPITLKDQIHYKGMACTFGSKRHEKFYPTENAPVVERLINVGASVLGKTNLPPFAMDFQCSNPVFGTSTNPWNTNYTTGGSSGGGAAAVAAGLSFLDIGTDLSGSLRIPASFCGVFSLLPTQDVLPNEGMMADGAPALRHFARFGPIARHADDLALAWKSLTGVSASSQREFTMPNVMWSVEGAATDVCGSIIRSFEKSVQIWHDAGVQIEQRSPEPFDFTKARCVFGEIMGYETGELMSAPVRFLARFFGRASAKRSPEFLANIMMGYRHSKKRYEAALQERHELSAMIDEFLGDKNVWLLPVTAASVFEHMEPASDRHGVRDYTTPLLINGKPANYFDALTSFVTPISLTGHPVVTLPLGVGENGLPIGAQLVGRKGQELQLIQTAKTLHQHLEMVDCPLMLQS